MKSVPRQQLIGDLKGGFTAALTAVPVELVYGLFAVAPLGIAFAEHGVRAALWGCMLGAVMGFLLRGTGGMLVGTRPATGLILGSLAAMLLQHPDIRQASDPASRVFILLLVCTSLAGLFQYLFGLVQVGRLLRYIPFPVLAGLSLGVGTLMILGSLRPALGASAQLEWTSLFQEWRPASLVVSLTALALCYAAPRMKMNIPGSLLALLIGSLVHHGLVLVLGPDQVGGTFAGISGLLPAVLPWNAGIDVKSMGHWLPVLASYALTIAAFGSLETLLCLSAIGNARSMRPDGNYELRVQGLGNLVAGVLGATASVGNLSRVRINLDHGATSSLSGVAHALTLAILIGLAGNLLSLVPEAVTAGIVIYFAIGMADDGTRRITQQLIILRRQIGREYYRILLSNFSVIMLVASVAVIGDMMKAVGVGLISAMFLFIGSRVNRSIRRVTHADRRHSLKVRSGEDRALLDREGMRIIMIEVDGPLFFGTSDSIAEEVEKGSATSDQVIVDFRHVTDIDPTGARILLQVGQKLRTGKKLLRISNLNPLFEHFLLAMGVESVVPRSQWHPDLDQALEAAEDALLSAMGGHVAHRALSLGETALAEGLSPAEVRVLAGFLIRKMFDAPGVLFHIDESGDSLFVAEGSSVDILIPLKEGKHKRIVSLAPGVIFGEMALLEGKPRSTTAMLLEPGLVWELKRSAFDELLLQHPQVARQVLFNVGRQLAGRLRASTSEVIMLAGE